MSNSYNKIFLSILLAYSVNAMAEEQIDSSVKKSPQQVNNLDAIYVSAAPLSNQSSLIKVISEKDILNHSRDTVGSMLTNTLGVSEDTFGVGASRPVIRGQAAPRVKIMTDGTEILDASTISPDHVVTAETFLAKQVEIIRGPSALLYGGGIGGTVNILDYRIPTAIPVNNVSGLVAVQHSNVDKGNRAGFTVTAGAGNIAANISGELSRTHDYALPKWTSDRLKDSDSKARNFSTGVSFIWEKGYVGLAYSEQHKTYGLPGHSHEYENCHTHGSSLHCITHDHDHDHAHSHDHDHAHSHDHSHDHDHAHSHDHDHAHSHDHSHDHDHAHNHDHSHDHDHAHSHDHSHDHDHAHSHDHSHDHDHAHSHDHSHDHDHAHSHDHDHDHSAYAKLHTKRLDLRSDIYDPFAGFDRLRVRASFTDYKHDEFDAAIPVTSFKNKGQNLRVELRHKPWNQFYGAVGVQLGQNRFESMGVEAFIPSTKVRKYAIFITESYRFNDQLKFDLSIRNDNHTLHADRPEGRKWQRKALPERHYHLWSSSASLVWNFSSDYEANLAFAYAQRAPSPQELYAEGVHLATNAYERGDANLQKELAQNIDIGLAKISGDLLWNVSVYHNRIKDYIYARELDRFRDFSLIQYSQNNAQFSGIEAETSYQLNPYVKLGIFGDYVVGKFTSGGYLPRIPAASYGVQAQFNFNNYLSAFARIKRVASQHKVAQFETTTPGYNMLNMGVNYNYRKGRMDYNIYLTGTNLLNKRAYNHSSWIVKEAPLPGRNILAGFQVKF